MDGQGRDAESDQLSELRQHAETVDDLRDDDDAEVRAQVAGLTATVASQLSEITAEMNRIRAALGSDTDIGDIQAELDALRAQLTIEARGAAPTRAATSARGDLRRRLRSAPAHDDRLDGVDDCAPTDRPRLGLITSIVLLVLMLGGPLWPLTAQAIASFSSMGAAAHTPWYDQVVIDLPGPHTR